MPQSILSLCTATKMGLTSYLNPFGSSSTESKRAEEVRAGTRAPDRTERKKCWEARDGYFACLDKNGILDAIKDEKAAAKACGGENVVFERDCAREWVSSCCSYSRDSHDEARSSQGYGEIVWLTGSFIFNRRSHISKSGGSQITTRSSGSRPSRRRAHSRSR